MFCWTKMGFEAGQSLSDIVRRKELERRASNGVFAWSIGTPLGSAASEARGISPGGALDVLFTPLKNAPKAIDRAPGQLLLWMSYITPKQGIVDLSPQELVTSRGGAGKRAHYALLCHSDEDISVNKEGGFLYAAHAKKFISKRPVGASQVTAVVQYKHDGQPVPERPYKIAFRAKLHSEVLYAWHRRYFSETICWICTWKHVIPLPLTSGENGLVLSSMLRGSILQETASFNAIFSFRHYAFNPISEMSQLFQKAESEI